VVAKDSGGPAGAKIEAAAQRGLKIVLIARPDPPPGPLVADVEGAIAWLEETLFSGSPAPSSSRWPS